MSRAGSRGRGGAMAATPAGGPDVMADGGAAGLAVRDPEAARRLAGRTGILALIATECSFFGAFVVTYLFYLGRSIAGPEPAQVLDLPIVATVCLLSSSVTVVFAVRALRQGAIGSFNTMLLVTVGLGVVFLAATADEWARLIDADGLTIATNLFGTTFYTLVGAHAAHVTIGVTLLTITAVLGMSGRIGPANAEPVEMLSWYWHFVDAVWVVVFTVVYVVGR